MARRVFFSFHYDRDVMRVMQVRSSSVMRPGDTAQPFYDKAEFEDAKRRAGGIERWMDEQLAGTSLGVVLYGRETYARPRVLHEIERSYERDNGILAIAIHGINGPRLGADQPRPNPLSYVSMPYGGVSTPLSWLYPFYDWVAGNGRANMPSWIETAARAAER